MRLLAWIVRLYSLTLHYLVEDSAGYFSNRLERPAIFLLWHNRVLGPAAYYRRRCRQRPACVLTSTSPEGGLVALFLGHFRLETVRVATLPRAANAMRELARRIGEQQDVIVTPDGPLGPRYYLKPGALYLAQTTGCPIVPLHVEYSRYVRLKSWDGFVLPLPLSRVKITFDKPFWVNASSEDDEFETERRRIEQTMISALVMDRNATGR